MEVSNKTLGVLLIAAIVVSLGGTFVSLNKLGGVSPTGYATNNVTGTVQLTVGTSTSIVINTDTYDNVVDFGECSPGASMLFLDSDNGASVGDNAECTGSSLGASGDYIQIENDGNIDANVTVRASVNGTNLFDTNGGLAYKMTNTSGDEGCYGLQAQLTYLNFTVEDDGSVGGGDDNPLCSNLTFADSTDMIDVSFQVALPPSTTSAGSSTITFEARPSSG